MAHYKRKRPKEHRHLDCCMWESRYDSGNNRSRVDYRDRKKPQFHRDDEYHVAESSKGKDAAFVMR